MIKSKTTRELTRAGLLEGDSVESVDFSHHNIIGDDQSPRVDMERVSSLGREDVSELPLQHLLCFSIIPCAVARVSFFLCMLLGS